MPLTLTKNIAVIPARGGSKRLPNKNIISLGGKPLVAHSIIYAKDNSNIIDEVYVSTDDPEIKRVAIDYGAKVIDRPASLSSDHSSTASALQHAVHNIEDKPENVFLLQPTNPLRPKDLLVQAYDKFINGDFDSLMTVTRIIEKFGKITKNRFEPFNYSFGQRSQDIEPLYSENGLLYITKAGLISKGIILAENNFPFVVDSPYTKVDIDNEADLRYAEYLIETSS
ncbi:MAG: acylneuraminate cytidylyltransferase family protein [Flavobacteriaceae bacterium]|nr:acylneuraminate cytidylyltransferase family protein [Flavobacteriaceae bacterium]